MTINVLNFYMAAVFCFSLLRIRKLIDRVNRRNTLKRNNRLLNTSLALFITSGVTSCSVLIVCILNQNVDTMISREKCRRILSLEICYALLWLNLLLRSLFTNYFNVKFVRENKVSNKHFFMCFNDAHKEAYCEVD